MRRVVVTGLGMVSPLGLDVESSWKALLAGECGIGPITEFDASEFGCRIDYRLLQRMNVILQPYLFTFKVENRVSYHLTGSMESDVPTPIDTIKGCSPVAQKTFIHQQIGFRTAFAQRIYGRMLAQQQVLFCRPILSFPFQQCIEEVPLPFPALGIIDHPQIFINHLFHTFFISYHISPHAFNASSAK